MTHQKISFYFVLYIVILVDFLMVINERDYAEEAMRGVVDSLIVAVQHQPLTVYAPERMTVKPGEKSTVVLSPLGLRAPEERASVRYNISPVGEPRAPWEFTSTKDSMGKGLFTFTPTTIGTFRFLVVAQGKRQVASMQLPESIRELITEKQGKLIPVPNDSVRFEVEVTAKGAEKKGATFQNN